LSRGPDFVLGRELPIQGTLVDTLREQLADAAAGVVHRLALHHDTAAERLVVFEQGRAGDVDLDFERDLQFAAVTEHRPVGAGQTRRPEVLIVSVFPRDGLYRAIGELDLGALASGEVASAGPLAGFEHGDVVAEFAQLIRGDEPADARAEHHDFHAGSRARLGPNGFGERALHGQQPQ
jgi:hypothetical protein